MKESVDHKTNAPYVNSSDASLESKGKEFREQSTIQKNFRSSKRTISDSPDELKQNLGLEPLQFGSPFAYLSYQNKHDFFKGLLKEGTRVLFDQVVAEASTLRERLLTGIGHATNGSNGQFCILREWVSSEESNGDGSKLELFCFEPSDNYLKISLFVVPISAGRTGLTSLGAISSNSSPRAVLHPRQTKTPEMID